jgi:hypothetical protein
VFRRRHCVDIDGEIDPLTDLLCARAIEGARGAEAIIAATSLDEKAISTATCETLRKVWAVRGQIACVVV